MYKDFVDAFLVVTLVSFRQILVSLVHVVCSIEGSLRTCVSVGIGTSFGENLEGVLGDIPMQINLRDCEDIGLSKLFIAEEEDQVPHLKSVIGLRAIRVHDFFLILSLYFYQHARDSKKLVDSA